MAKPLANMDDVVQCRPVFDWIKGRFAEQLAFPTLREICDAGFKGVSSTSQASKRLEQMHRLGWLERELIGSMYRYKVKGAKVVYMD